MKTTLPILVVTKWINISKFITNEILLNISGLIIIPTVEYFFDSRNIAAFALIGAVLFGEYKVITK